MNHSPAKDAVRTTLLSILVNIIMTLFKGVAGYFGHSYALMADAIESATDIFSSILVWVGIQYSSKPPDENHPYGHGKVEPLLTFLVVGFLVSSATIIAVESIRNIRTPHPMPHPYTLLVLLVVVVIKEGFYRFSLDKSKTTHSSVLKAEAWHHRSDAITSIIAFIGISVALILGPGYEAADDWAALIASGFILYNGYRIFRPALGEIMDEHLYDELIHEIRVVSSRVEGVLGTEKCHVRKTGMSYFIDLHAVVTPTISVIEGHEIAHRLKDRICEEIPSIRDVLVHIEPG